MVRFTGFVLLTAALLSGCMSMMISDEQRATSCQGYADMLANPQVTAAQRAQILDGMRQMECANIPAQ